MHFASVHWRINIDMDLCSIPKHLLDEEFDAGKSGRIWCVKCGLLKAVRHYSCGMTTPRKLASVAQEETAEKKPEGDHDKESKSARFWCTKCDFSRAMDHCDLTENLAMESRRRMSVREEPSEKSEDVSEIGEEPAEENSFVAMFIGLQRFTMNLLPEIQCEVLLTITTELRKAFIKDQEKRGIKLDL